MKKVYVTEKEAKNLIEKEINILSWSADLQDIKRKDSLSSYIVEWIFTEWTNFIRLYEQDIDLFSLRDTHEAIRSVLTEHNFEEYGDCIIDEICVAVWIPGTTEYYIEWE